MILTAHILTGAAVAVKIQPVSLGLTLAFLSHFLLDFLFHREYKIDYLKTKEWRKAFFDFFKVFLDIFLGFFIVFILSKNIPVALLGGFFAILPDGLTLLFLIFPKIKILEKFHDFHCKKTHYFRDKKIPFSLEILSQILAIFIAVFFLLQ